MDEITYLGHLDGEPCEVDRYEDHEPICKHGGRLVEFYHDN